MRTTVLTHATVDDAMARLRDAGTPSGEFRRLVYDVTTALTLEATRDLTLSPGTVLTPLGTAQVSRIAEPVPLAVPILRAGLGMLDAFLRIVPSAEAGFLGLKRDEVTREPRMYADRMPARLDGRHVFVLDPMLATGGSLSFAVNMLLERGAARVTCLCVVSAPEGIAALEAAVADRPVELWVAAADAGLNASGFITPGLGDAGDRLFGLA